MARAAGIAIPATSRETVLRRMAAGGGHVSTMAEDVRAGRLTEITQLDEHIARCGQALGIRRRHTTRCST